MKKAVITFIQICITIGLLYWVFQDDERRNGVAQALGRAEWPWLLGALLVFLLIFIGAAVRWLLLVRVHGIPLRFTRATALTFIGQFFSMFLPGATAGDVLKIFYVMKEAAPEKKSAALLSVLMDRLVGLVALVLISCITIGIQYQWLLSGGPTASKIVWFFMAMMGAMFGGVAFSFLITGLGLVEKLPKWTPLRSKFVELAEAYNIYARAWPTTLGAMAIAIFMHLATFFGIYLAARSISVPTDMGQIFTLMPIIGALTAIPISPGGLGVREGLFTQLMSGLTSVPEGDAATISIFNYILYAAMGLIGGVLFLIYRSSGVAPAASLSSMEHAVEAQEEKIESGA